MDRATRVNTTQIVLLGLAAVLLFWAVGAYNRLVQLRNAIVRDFAPVDAQYTQLLVLLARKTEALAPLAQAGQRLDALRAACLQVERASAHARVRPGATGAIVSLRLADDILTEARARLPVHSVAGVDLTALNGELAAADTTLQFARRQFNVAVEHYNKAVRQFPTWLLARLFGFRPAGTL